MSIMIVCVDIAFSSRDRDSFQLNSYKIYILFNSESLLLLDSSNEFPSSIIR